MRDGSRRSNGHNGPQLREAWGKAGMLKQTFLDLLLIALGPQKALEHINVAVLLQQSSELNDKPQEKQDNTAEIDAPIRSHSGRSDSEDTGFGELMADKNALDPENLVIEADMHKKVREVVLSLGPKEKEIIHRRFDIGGNEPETLEEIAADFGVSRERIRQIEEKALYKLRHPSRRKLLQDFVDND